MSDLQRALMGGRPDEIQRFLKKTVEADDYTINVKEFGAFGNGTSDDTAAIQAAINKAASLGGGRVFFPTGTYLLDTITTNNLKWCLSVTSDNITFDGEAAEIKVTGDAAAIFFAGPARNGAGFVNYSTQRWGPKLTVYTLTGTYTKGAMSITLATPADVTTMGLVAGSYILLRTGQTVTATNDQPDGEINEVVSASATTGVVVLKRPLSKPYAQEYFISGTSGKTSTSVTANLAPFGISHIDPYMLRNIAVKNLKFNMQGLTTQNPFVIMHADNVLLQNLEITTSRNGFDAWGIRDYSFEDLRINHVAAGTWWAVPLGATCQTNGVARHIRAQAPLGVAYLHIHEGAANVIANDVKIFCGATGSTNGVVSIRSRGYDISILNSYFHSQGTVTAVFADDTVLGGVLFDNNYVYNESGGAIRLSATNQIFGRNNRIEKGDVYLQQSTGIAIVGPVAPVSMEMIANWVSDDNLNPTIGNIPNGAYVTNVRVHVTQAFNSDGTDQVTVGWDAGVSALATAVDVSTTGVKTVTLGVSVGYRGAAKSIEAYYTAGGSAPTTGRAIVVVEFYRCPYEVN